jgi:hypothetical protein
MAEQHPGSGSNRAGGRAVSAREGTERVTRNLPGLLGRPTYVRVARYRRGDGHGHRDRG